MFGKELDDALLTAAKVDNEEICGYVLDNDLVLVPNEAEDPSETFYISDAPDGIEAIVHSHPGGPFYPSAADMAQQIATDVPWGIACYVDGLSEVVWFGDDVPKAPIIGRGFRHGVTDCYELIRDIYSECYGVTLKQFPRSWEWWTNEENLYADGFSDAGFVETSVDNIRSGDVLLMSVLVDKINHAAVYIGDGLIIHHLCGREGYDPSRLSVIEPAERWMKYVSKVVTYEKSDIERGAVEALR